MGNFFVGGIRITNCFSFRINAIIYIMHCNNNKMMTSFLLPISMTTLLFIFNFDQWYILFVLAKNNNNQSANKNFRAHFLFIFIRKMRDKKPKF